MRPESRFQKASYFMHSVKNVWVFSTVHYHFLQTKSAEDKERIGAETKVSLFPFRGGCLSRLHYWRSLESTWGAQTMWQLSMLSFL